VCLDACGDASHQIDVDDAVAHREGVVATRDIDIGCGGFLERERGDWHDTLLTASAGGGTTVTVRMQTDTFTGKAVVHCHILEHEDEGMMAWFSITGIENTTYAAATTLDPTCYRGVFSSSVNESAAVNESAVNESAVKSSHANYVRDASLLVVMWSWLVISV
jgi:hypothetical protein